MSESIGNGSEHLPKQEEKLSKTLQRHVIDLPSDQSGAREGLKELGAPLIGFLDSTVNRPTPPLKVEQLRIAPGESKVLIGPNGSGKSTLYDAIIGHGAYISSNNGEGAAIIGKSSRPGRDGVRVALLNQEALLQDLEDMPAESVLEQTSNYYLSQFPEPEDADWVDDYEKSLATTGARHRIEKISGKLTSIFNMEDFLDKKVGKLSGGERTKLSLCMVLLSEPDILMADEPTNHLDLESTAKLSKLFDVYAEAGSGIISTSHVEWFLRMAGKNGVQEIMYDNDGRRVVASGSSFEDYMKNASRESVKTINGDISWEEADKKHDIVIRGSAHLTIPESPIQDVKISDIAAEDRVVLSGENGTGKTTLLQHFVEENSEHSHMAYLPQFWPDEINKSSVGLFYHWVKENTNADAEIRISFVERLSEVEFGGKKDISEEILDKPLQNFSVGEQRLLWFLAVSTIPEISTLVLDEPTNHVDKAVTEKVTEAIQSWQGAVIVSTHDVDLLKELGRQHKEDQRPLKHLLLKKEGRKTRVTESHDSPEIYVQQIFEDAEKKARQVKLQ